MPGSMTSEAGDAGTLLAAAREDARQGRLEQALARIEAAKEIASGDARLSNQAGQLLGRLGRLDEAVAEFRRAVELDPDLAAARFNLAMSELGRGELKAALASLKTVTGRWPRMAPGWLQLGGVLNALGRYTEAEQALRRHLQLAPDSADGLTWLGAAIQLQGRFDEAGRCYQAALANHPGHGDALANLGKLLLAQGEPDQAESCFRRALAADPGHDQARSGLAAWLDNRGRQEEALELLDGRPGAEPAVVAPIRARLLRRSGRHAEARGVLEDALASPALTAEGQAQLRFSLAQVLDETGHFDQAWSMAEAANALRRQSFPAGVPADDVTALEQAVSASRETFSAAAMAALPRASTGSEQPVFIVGMPRSGKSLAEQILCSHPMVRGAGELTDIGDISLDLGRETGGWPAGVCRLDADMLDRQARRYLARLAARAGAAERITDTMPFNFVHIGLIELLFPGARVIHCVRHPLDLALRCWLKNFAGRSLAFTFDLAAMAAYFGQYRVMMDHWRRVSGLRMLDLPYEGVVGDPETWSRRLVEFTGLEWDPRCLRFYEPGVASSAGDTPLREPLSDREVGSWRRYARWLRPLFEDLDSDGHGRQSD